MGEWTARLLCWSRAFEEVVKVSEETDRASIETRFASEEAGRRGGEGERKGGVKGKEGGEENPPPRAAKIGWFSFRREKRVISGDYYYYFNLN